MPLRRELGQVDLQPVADGSRNFLDCLAQAVRWAVEAFRPQTIVVGGARHREREVQLIAEVFDGTFDDGGHAQLFAGIAFGLVRGSASD